MDKFKMVCLDIDGTLLNSDYRISEKTKEVIRVVANEKHIPVILVSARMPKGILFLQKELEIVQPVICYSGALIWDNGHILSNITMPISEVKKVYNLAKAAGINISIYKDDEWYIEELDAWAKQESEITTCIPVNANFNELFNKWEQADSGPNKILCMAKPEDMKRLAVEVKANCADCLNVYPSKSTYLEIMPVAATKTFAIEFLSRKFGIQKYQIIAIGDNYNDIDMIKFAGLGIAMGNAPEDVKMCADAVTLSNDEDGVAEALKKYLRDTSAL